MYKSTRDVATKMATFPDMCMHTLVLRTGSPGAQPTCMLDPMLNPRLNLTQRRKEFAMLPMVPCIHDMYVCDNDNLYSTFSNLKVRIN